jgi:hypothetical protein
MNWLQKNQVWRGFTFRPAEESAANVKLKDVESPAASCAYRDAPAWR